MKKAPFLLAVTCGAALLSGCATPPSKSFVRCGPTYDQQIHQVRRLGVVSDAVVVYDRATGKDNVSIADSLIAATNMLADAAHRLNHDGYDVVFTAGPLVGAFEPPTTSMLVADTRHGARSDRLAPFVIAPAIAKDKVYRDALLQVVRQAFDAVSDHGELPTDTFRSNPDTLQALKILSERKHVDYLMVVVGNGLIVSGGKQVGQVLATSVLSTIMTAGLVTISEHNISFLDSYVALIHLTNGEVVWSNSLRIPDNPAASSLYHGEWSRMLLYYLPNRNVTQN